MIKKVISVILAICASAFLFTGCNKDTPKNSAPNTGIETGSSDDSNSESEENTDADGSDDSESETTPDTGIETGSSNDDNDENKDENVDAPQYIVKGEIGSVVFTMNVKYHAKSEETTQVAYYSGCGFGEYEVTRVYYDFIGLKYNGKVYEYQAETNNYGALAAVIVNSGETVVNVTAVWECDCSNAHFDVTAYSEDGITVFGYTNKASESEKIQLFHLPVVFEDSEGEDYYDLMDNLYMIVMNKYQNIYTYDEDLNRYNANFANYVYISVNDIENGRIVLPIEEMNFLSIIAHIEMSFGLEIFDTPINISIAFIFEKGEKII